MDPVTAIASAVGGLTNLATGVMDYAQKKRLAKKTREYGGMMGDYYSGLAEQAGSRDYTNTAYGQYLQRIAKEGLYGPAEEQQMLSKVSRQTAGLADEARQQYYGALASRGLEGSVSAVRGANEIKAAQMQNLSDASLAITQSERQAMRGAEEAYAANATQYEEQQRQLADQYRLQELANRYGLELEALGLQGAGSQSLVSGIGSGVGAIGTGLVSGANMANENIGLEEQVKLLEKRLAAMGG